MSNDATWQACLQTRYAPDELPDFEAIDAAAAALDPALIDRFVADAPERTVPRSLHPCGSCARVRLERLDPGPEQVEAGALLRLSASARPSPGPDLPFIVGAALRLEGPGGVDAVFACPLTGAARPWPLSVPLSNALEDPPARYGRSQTVEALFAALGSEALERARIPGSALVVPAPDFVARLGGTLEPMLLVPAPELGELGDEEDFRETLDSLSPGTVLFVLELGGGVRWRVRLETGFVASLHGDEALMFRHDYGQRPSGVCPFSGAAREGAQTRTERGTNTPASTSGRAAPPAASRSSTAVRV